MPKFLFAAAAASLLLASAASAQTTTPPAPTSATTPVPAAHPTIDSTIEALIADPVTKSVLEKHLPALDQHPAYGQFKNMTLRGVEPYSEGKVTDEMITAIDAELKALPKA